MQETDIFRHQKQNVHKKKKNSPYILVYARNSYHLQQQRMRTFNRQKTKWKKENWLFKLMRDT